MKDIAEREDIIRRFQTTGQLDRDDAIEKFLALQGKDAELMAAMAVKQAQNGSIDIHFADNNLIIINLQFQVDCLKAKFLK